MCFTFNAPTPNSKAAETPCAWPSGAKGGTMLATLRTTNNSPGRASKITSGDTRESEQPITMISGRCPVSASAWKRLCSRGSRSLRKAP